ncbi:pantoate--beta-alanine ligase [Albimonas pacifica]|uniref:pantoate--beta-alanine ligase (AMP-forming) n=1 Tax=Albimonas pacifica TaxID=1114924 RepID=A0A1I3J4N6_9RHOB|nr:pantoate--beta-alanine ligase [Albimonas pacifica]SFI54938.1 pantoate--beta-alanine ligase [Albimonas pacifica]
MQGLPILRSTPQLRSRIRSWRAFGETVAVVPVGRSLHEGHLALIRAARGEADRVLAVVARWCDGRARGRPEPGAGEEDFDELEAAERVEEAGADAVYLPSAESLFPAAPVVEIHLRGLTDVLCGEERPERFEGFALAFTRLLSQAQADVAVLGERDWQRLAILRRLAIDLDLPTEVRSAPTERDMDGVAWAEGAQDLAGEDRAAAVRLWRELKRAAAAIDAGGDVDATLDAAADALADAGAEVEYLDLRDAETLAEVDDPAGDRPARIFAAIALGDLRLIDNVPLGEARNPLDG